MIQGPLRLSIAGLAFIAVVLCAGPGRALDYPTRTVRVIMPFSPGGAPDVLVRIVGQALSERWGQAVVIENRAGGNTMAGTVAAARSDPDAYTLLFTGDQTFILNPLLYASLPYSEQDLEPVVLLATSPHLLAVNKTVPASTVQELVALAKAKPGTLLYGSTGQLRALAISTVRRSPLAPDLPTMQESGVIGYCSQAAFGFMAPAGVPHEIREKVYKDVAEVLKQPALRHRLEERSFELSGIGPAEFKNFIADEKSKWRRVITEANIKGD